MLDHPREVGMDEAGDPSVEVLAVQVRRMHVTGFVGALVMAPVHRHPGDHRPERPHRAHGRQRSSDEAMRLERAVGEQAMEANSDAEPGHEPHREEQAELDRPDRAVSEQRQRDERPREGHEVEQNEMPQLHAVQVGAVDRLPDDLALRRLGEQGVQFRAVHGLSYTVHLVLAAS